MQNFSEVVLRMMKEKGITVAQIAKNTGYSWPYINDLIKGNRRWNEDTMEKVSKAVGLIIYIVPVNDLSATGTNGN